MIRKQESAICCAISTTSSSPVWRARPRLRSAPFRRHIDRFAPDVPPFDDITMLPLRRSAEQTLTDAGAAPRTVAQMNIARCNGESEVRGWRVNARELKLRLAWRELH